MSPKVVGGVEILPKMILSKYNTEGQLRDRAYRMLREGLGIEGEEEEDEDDLLQRLLDQGLLEPI